MSSKFGVSMLVIVGLAAALAVAGGTSSIVVAGAPLYLLCVALAFAMQWLAFVPAWLWHTERFYDLMGGITYLTIVVFIMVTVGHNSPRSQLLGLLVAIWAVRLSGFLFIRVLNDGFDRRFEKIKFLAGRFFITWSLQGLWVSFTGAAAFVAMSANPELSGESIGHIDLWAIVGGLLWLAGFAFEVVADSQKRRFRAIPENRERFIQSGLWARCRHPNYFGEIVLWLGIAVIAFPALEGWANLALISPVFVFLLLTRISGIPLLAASAKKRWGDTDEYQQYLRNTPLLLPRFF